MKKIIFTIIFLLAGYSNAADRTGSACVVSSTPESIYRVVATSCDGKTVASTTTGGTDVLAKVNLISTQHVSSLLREGYKVVQVNSVEGYLAWALVKY